MKLIHTEYGYNFYIGKDAFGIFYNVVPIGQKEPTAGYYKSDYICKIKNVRNIFENAK